MSGSKHKSLAKEGNQQFTQKLIDLMNRNEYFSAADIVRELGLSYQEGIKYIAELQNKKIITKAKISNNYYKLNDKYRKS